MACRSLVHWASEKGKLLAQKENLLVPDDRTALFSSPVISTCKSQKKKKTILRPISCILLANNRSIDITQLALTSVGWPNSEKLVGLLCKFDLDQNEHKSLQVNEMACAAWPNGVASRPKFSTCVYLQVRLART